MDIFTLLSLGFGLGLLHALDADHVMAVSAMSQQRFSLKQTLLFSMNWALGHGGVLLMVGLVFFGLGYEMPENFRLFAEKMVGVLLVTVGGLLFWQLHKESLTITTHTHHSDTGAEIKHTHLHKTDDAHPLKNKHTPVMVGILHGLAGSAPALALIPALASGEMAMLYLLVFSVGVISAMLVFGLSWRLFQKKIELVNQKLYQWLRRFIATSAIVMGTYLIATV